MATEIAAATTATVASIDPTPQESAVVEAAPQDEEIVVKANIDDDDDVNNSNNNDDNAVVVVDDEDSNNNHNHKHKSSTIVTVSAPSASSVAIEPMNAAADMPPIQRPLTDPLSPAQRNGSYAHSHDDDDAAAPGGSNNNNDNNINNNNNNEEEEADADAEAEDERNGHMVSPIARSDSRSTVATDLTDSSYGDCSDGSYTEQQQQQQRASGFRLDRWGNMIVGDAAAANRPSLRLERDRIRRDTSRENKWLRMIRNWERFRTKNPDKVKERIRKGIPDSMRATIWPTLTGAREQLAQSRKLYSQLLGRTSEFEAVIGRDINRTFPRHILFRKHDNLEDDVMALEHKDKINESKGQGALFNVCKCYSIYDPDVGYCQGMGFVAGLLLMYTSEEEAFWNMERIMRGDKFRLRALFLPGFPLLRQFFYQLTHLMEWYMPALARHFDEQGLMPDLFATQWFLTLFARTFPTELVLRIWDIFLNEGIKIVFRVALYILKTKSKSFVQMDIGGIMPVLQNIQNDPMFADADMFMNGVMGVPLSRKRLATLEKAYLSEQMTAATAAASSS